MVLLLAAGLLTRGLQYTQTVEPGFEMQEVAAAFLTLRAQGYEMSRATSFARSLRERMAGFPGVTEVAQAETAPLSDDRSVGDFTIPGWSNRVQIEYNHVSPEYFSVVGTPLAVGRGFTTADTPESSSVIITASTALRLWPSENPLGKTLRDGNSREYSVIGVVRDAQLSRLGERNTLYLFFPAGPADDGRCYLLVRFAGDYQSIRQGVRDAVRSLDPDVAVKVNRLDEYLEFWRAPSRIVVALAGGLGALALLLAVIGVYGTVSYNVNRRVREIGIRIALGASSAGVMRVVFRQAMRPVLIGGAIGVLTCVAVSRVLSSMLFGVSPRDPIAFVSGSLFLLVVAFWACWVPARKATRVDPMVTLRCE